MGNSKIDIRTDKQLEENILGCLLSDAKDSMGRPVSAGVYLYQIQAGEFVQTKKMVLLK